MTRIILKYLISCLSTLAVALTLPAIALAQAQIDGAWINTSSTFQLDVVSSGSLVCGNYNASSGDKLDFSAFIGSRKGKTMHVFFRNGFTETDSQSLGDASLFIEHGLLKWRLLHAPTGESYVWEKSELHRVKENLSSKQTQMITERCNRLGRKYKMVTPANAAEVLSQP